MWAFIERIKLRLDPPKPGDVYLADPFEFIIGKPIEKRLHGLCAKDGDALWQVIPSDNCYRFTIESIAMPYYRCTAEALCKSVCGDKTEWKKRCQPRRMSKEYFHDMIVEGRLKKYEIR